MLDKRPKIISINSVITENYLSVRGLVGVEPVKNINLKHITPVSRVRLLKKKKFNIHFKINDNHSSLETDQYGFFSYRERVSFNDSLSSNIEFTLHAKQDSDATLYFLGSYQPSILTKQKKIVISDFDKTLVETKYKTFKEVYQSLTLPIINFPTLKFQTEFLKEKINEGHLPFILSSSPNFYGPSIKEWLKLNNIPSDNIFLKDYRQFLSLFPSDLFLKDISSHGVHKLSQLINIYLMTNIPSEIVLMGDNSESDPLIYSIFAKIAADDFSPDDLWNEIKSKKEFLFTNTQSLKFLNKLYQAKNLNRNKKAKTKISIYIRPVPDKKNKSLPKFLEEYQNKIEYFKE